eukprot:4447591-Alexandrium_andersonii.AAC.1
MSASLVGSEMCIRDRASEALRAVLRLRGASGQRLCHGQPRAVPHRAKRCLLYTSDAADDM